jgi:hypothetical protein
MRFNPNRVWHIAAGDTNRSYGDILIHWDLVALGPGRFGSWPGCRPALEAQGWKRRSINAKLRDLERLYTELVPGDVVLLRLGTGTLLAVGEVADQFDGRDGYAFRPDFGDIDGWDLQHTRRIRWLWHSGAAGPQSFPTYSFSFGQTIKRELQAPVRRWLEGLTITADAYTRPLAPLPPISPTLSEARLVTRLDAIGLSGREVLAALHRLRAEAGIYGSLGVRPAEHETVAYLVLPLLEALGWQHSQVGIEWKKVDVALFNPLQPVDSLLRAPRNLIAVLEAKGLHSSALTAVQQAATYAVKVGGACRRLIVTDGTRYGIFLGPGNGTFDPIPHAYLSVYDFQDTYPILHCSGTVEALWAMCSGWSPSITPGPLT